MKVTEHSSGAGPTTLFLHGVGFNASCWQFVTSAARGRTLLLDLPGHGLNRELDVLPPERTVEGIEHLLRARRVTTLNIVGHSLGTWLALALATRKQVEVEGLLLLAPTAGLDPDQVPAYEGFIGALQAGSDLVALGSSALFAPSFFERHPTLKPAAEHELRQAGSSVTQRELELSLQMRDLRPSLREVKAKTVLRCGALDGLAGPARAQPLGQSIPGATVEVVPDAAHALMFEDVQGTRAAVERLTLQ